MALICIGVSHHSADLALLERLAVPSDGYPKVLRSLLELDHVLEAAVLSTCNRVEVYAEVTRFHAAIDELRAWFAERAELSIAQFDRIHYARYDEQVAEHLFSVAAGIESMVVGERQITVQVRAALEAARSEDTARRILRRLFDQAIKTSRRVRSETDIEVGASSMVDVGLDAVAGLLDDGRHPTGGITALQGRTVLLIGAGKMGGLSADRVADHADRVLVWNRSEDKAVRLATRIGGELVRDQHLADAVAAADVVVCTTGAGDHVVDSDLVATALGRRDSDVRGLPAEGDVRPLVLLDLSMPRNVDPACDAFPGVTVVDISTVRDVAVGADTGVAVAAAREVVAEESRAFGAWTRAVAVEPTIKDLRRQAEAVRVAELERLASRLGDLDDRQREAVEALTRGIVNTLLHQPTVTLKDLADRGGAEHHAHLVRELFDLDG